MNVQNLAGPMPLHDSDRFGLAGRRVLVTGASAGIGYGIAQILGEAGARVALVARNRESLTRACSQLGESGIDAHPVEADLSQSAELESVVERTVDALGGLDIVVSNAGMAEWGSTLGIDRETFDRHMALNVWAPFRVVQLAHPHLVASPFADRSVVMIGSIDGERPSGGASLYGATKGALRSMVVALAKEWRDDGIRVNLVAPGLVETPMAQTVVDELDSSPVRINLVGRAGQITEIGGMVLYLVSSLGRFTNGTRFTVDGGALASGPFDGFAN